ncbi:MAG: uroporphyrinogen decarboxylase family protein [Oscillospiraceae bacterium]|nr:uroporphyrinogen decarboxylase family protein [Oscillospiraceae bacterium]
MRDDALAAIECKMPDKIPQKERLNNEALFVFYGGVDPYQNLESAYVKTLLACGIDMVSGIPHNSEAVRDIDTERLLRKGDTIYSMAPLGVMPTYQVRDYGFTSIEDVLAYDPDTVEYHGLWLLSNSNNQEILCDRYMQTHKRNALLADDGFLTYPYFYTTLFMWCMETFGMEMFMIAAMEEEDAFDGIIEKFANRSKKHIQAMLETDAPVIVLHDDLAFSNGPAMSPEWFRRHIFPRYKELLAPIKQHGKKVLLTIDGRIDELIDDLADCGFDGFEIECPATDLSLALRRVGKEKSIIGGIDNRIMAFGTPGDVERHTEEILSLGRNYPGFILSNTGGFHGNIPLENSIVYFETAKVYGKR